MKGKDLLPEYVIFGGNFSDDGKGNDRLAGDGVYTSLHPGLIEGYSSLENKGGEIECDFRVVRCYDDDCPFWGGCCLVGDFCYCLDIYNCKIKISW